MSSKLPNLNFEKIRSSFQKVLKNYDIPTDYIVSKFYELGYKVQHNTYSNNYQGCCPICKEGKSWGRKKRCFYIPENNNIYCHNCGASMTPFNWISTVGQITYDQMWEEIKENDFGFIETFDLYDEDEVREDPSLPVDCINLFDPLQSAYYKSNKHVQSVLEYIHGRRLNTAVNKPDALYTSIKDLFHKHRLIIPFKNVRGKIVFYQSRKILDEDGPKYLSKIFADKTICGLDKVSDELDTVFIFEGPLDSFFVKNGIGLAGITEGKDSLTITQEDQLNELQFYKKIWVLDSQWLDTASRVKTKILLEQGETVFIWPKKYGEKFKDLNEMCVHHKLDQISPEFIQKNSTSGKGAILKFNMTFKS